MPHECIILQDTTRTNANHWLFKTFEMKYDAELMIREKHRLAKWFVDYYDTVLPHFGAS